MNHRVIVFGIDGGTFNVIAPLLKEGRLPTLARFAREGAAGELLSVVPPLTAPAWATFQTGLNPGRHGVFDFLAPPRLGYNRRLVNAAALASPRMFDALTAAGRSAGVINTPLTFPPRPLNGFIVPDLFAPAAEAKYFYPPALHAEIAALGPYRIDINPAYFEEGRDEEFLKDLEVVSATRLRVALELWKSKRPDLFVVVFTGVDRLMHFFWDQPRLVAAHYEWLDGALGEFARAAGDDVAILVVSDHGFGPVTGEADLATHLTTSGFMKLKKQGGANPRGFMDTIAKIDFLNLRKKLPKRWREAARGQVMDKLSAFAHVDWRATVAFPGTATQYGLYLNVRGREPEGTVARDDYERVRDDVIASLDALRPGLAARALRREEVYHGPFLDDAPDVYIPVWEDGIRLVEFSDDPAVRPRRRRPGEHRREGIFFAWGPAVAAGSRPAAASLADIYPTLMYLMGEGVPAGIDGRLLQEVITKERLAAHPPQARDYGPGGEEEYAGAEDARVRERLESMGYL